MKLADVHPSKLIAHPSQLVLLSAAFYLIHLLLIVKIAGLYLSAFGTLLFLGWALARKEVRFSGHILFYPLVVYAFVSIVSAYASENRPHMFGDGMLLFKILIFPGAVILYRELPRLRDLAVYAFAIVASGGSIWGLLQFVFLDRRDLDHRISGPSSHVMTYSGILLPLSLMMLLLFIRQRKWWQLTACILSTTTLLLTFTRSVWLGWAVAALVVLLSSRARLVFYAMPVVILFITFLPLDLFGRLISTFDLKQSSNFDRVRMLQAGQEMIRDFPVLGVGPANVKEVYSLYRKADAPRPRPPHLHNNVVQLWAERGILGLAAYLLLLGLFLRECIRAWKGPQRMWAEIGIAVTVSLTVAGLFEFNFGDTEVFYMLLNLFAFVAVAVERPLPVNEVSGELVPATN
jgi:O-antigen ligase